MVNRNGLAKPIFAMVCLVTLFLSGLLSGKASAQQRCQETDPNCSLFLQTLLSSPIFLR